MRYRFAYHLRRHARYVTGLLVLGALLLLTWGARAWWSDRVADRAAVRQVAATEQALTVVQRRFEALQSEVRTRARLLAQDGAITRGLRQHRSSPAGGAPDSLIRYLSELNVDTRTGLQVYGDGGRPLAWAGNEVVEPGTNGGATPAPDRPRVTVVEGNAHTAVAAWHPVQGRDGKVVGGVQVTRLVRFRAPVQNRYIRDYSIADTWSQASGYPVQVTWGRAAAQQTTAQRATSEQTTSEEEQVQPDTLRTTRVLADAQGDPLGRVRVQPPTEAQLVRAARVPFDNAMALWAGLLLLWGLWGLWRWYRLARQRLPALEPGAERQPELRRAVLRLGVVLAAGWGVRYAWIALDLPGRWSEASHLIAPLFNPAYLASTFGGGIMQSAGDLVVTSGFAVATAVVVVDFARHFRTVASSLRALPERFAEQGPARPSMLRFFSVLVLVTLTCGALVVGIAQLVQRAVLDSTLDFFSRTGLLPDPLVMVVIAALLLVAAAVVGVAVSCCWTGLFFMQRYEPTGWPYGVLTVGVTLVMAALIGVPYALLDMGRLVPLPVLLFMLGVIVTVATLAMVRLRSRVSRLTLRSLLPSVLTVTTLLYPLVFQGMDAQRRGRMTDAALSFEQGRDPRVLFAVEQVLERIRRDTLLQRSEVTAALRRSPQARTVPATGGRSTEDAGRLDTVATQLLQGSLLASLTAYDASLTLIGPDQQGLRYTAAGLEVQRTRLDADGRDTFRALLERYRLEQPRGPLVEQELTPQQSRRADGGLVYAGIAPLRPLSPGPRSSLFPPNPFGSGSSPEAAGPLGALPPLAGAAPADSAKVWAMVQVRSRSLLPGVGGAFPRVLLPDGSYSDLYAELSLAAFQDGTLARSIGRDFERVQLPAAVQQQLADEPTLWRTETVGQRQYLTHYRRAANGASTLTAGRGGADETASSVTAVRIPSIMVFDHLYYLLRIVVVGLGLALGFYLVGLYARWRRGLLPAEHVRFRDKVLNAFLAVGAVAVVAVGVVGVQVVTGENERVVGRRLQDDLDRVEEALALEARPDERIYRVAERVDIDSLAAQVGLDISLYRDGQLVRSSRPQLVRDGLVEARLPAPAYRAIYADAYRFITTEVRIGSFPYTIGVRALTDAEGRPRYSIAVPTLAQQERIREERARTLAYLFGALLLLVIAVMLTALLLANALTQPIAQLRAGLEAVGEGRFTQALPVTTRDEIGELVRTFNEMREQLAESRRKLAQQERELAWREMARQVAHEIKNPLTPMKLSVQHLRRAFRRAQPTGGRANEQSAGDGAAAEADDSRFGALFDRITSTLIEQIHALARIADEFSSFARLPTRVVESLDLNEVIREAESLMREEDTDITLDVTLHEEPLVIEADHEEMRRIFINLIKNAMQAIPDERDGRIEITTARIDIPDAPPRVRATVTDNGSGVPRDLRDKIFQPNFSTKTSGTGLGLAIAKKTIEELGGEIGFHTTEGVGTTFWLQLPTADAAPDDTGGVPPTPAQSGSPRGPANGDTTPSGDGAAPTSPSGADAEAEDASSNDAASGDPAPDDPDAGGATA